MTHSILVRSIRAALTGSAILGATISGAMAQEAPERPGQVVTGSHLKQGRAGSPTTLHVLSRQQIEKSGLTNVGDLLRELPYAGSSTNSQINTGGGETQIDLRNLGADRTLVLLNGRRLTPGLDGAMDLNAIPLSVVERIEVLTEGAAAVYGSGAMAGVINILTRGDFQGMEVNAQFGQHGDNDGEIQAYDFSVGTASDRGSVYFSAGYHKQEAVMAGDRDISAEPVFGTGVAFGSSTTPQGRFFGLFSGLSFVTTDPGTVPDSPDDFRAFEFGRDAYNYAPDNYLVTPYERTSVFSQSLYDLTDSIRLSAELGYVKQENRSQGAPHPLVFGPLLGPLATNYGVGADNPFNPFGVDLDDSAAVFQRRMVEAGPRFVERDIDQFRFRLGLQGHFEWHDRQFDWAVDSIYGQMDRSDIVGGGFNHARISDALSSACPQTPGCVPLNLFGGPGTITQQMIDYIAFEGHEEHEVRQRNTTASLNGELLDLPAGQMAFSLGYEYRQLEGFKRPDALVMSGQSADGPGFTTEGSVSVDEVYLEFAVPLLSSIDGSHRLDLAVAGRHADYDTSNSASAARVSLDWAPSEQWRIRASWSDDFRTPSIGELFSGNFDTFPFIRDPCENVLGLGTGEPAGPDLFANCVSNGVPADGSYIFNEAQIRVPVGSNPGLLEEQSESLTFGALYEPSWLEGLTLAADLYEIEVTNTPVSLGGQFILDSCAFDGLLCDRVQRGLRGSLVMIDSRLVNLGRIEIQGLDWGVRYQLPERDWGQLGLNWQSTYQAENRTGLIGFSQLQDNDRIGTNVMDEGWPRWRSSLDADWSRGDWSAHYSIQYIHHARESCDSRFNDPVFVNDLCLGDADGDGMVDTRSLGSTTYHDIQMSYHLADYDVRLTLGVRNLFDKGPPLSIGPLGGFNRGQYRAPGRFPYLRFTMDL